MGMAAMWRTATFAGFVGSFVACGGDSEAGSDSGLALDEAGAAQPADDGGLDLDAGRGLQPVGTAAGAWELPEQVWAPSLDPVSPCSVDVEDGRVTANCSSQGSMSDRYVVSDGGLPDSLIPPPPLVENLTQAESWRMNGAARLDPDAVSASGVLSVSYSKSVARAREGSEQMSVSTDDCTCSVTFNGTAARTRSSASTQGLMAAWAGEWSGTIEARMACVDPAGLAVEYCGPRGGDAFGWPALGQHDFTFSALVAGATAEIDWRRIGSDEVDSAIVRESATGLVVETPGSDGDVDSVSVSRR